MNTKFVIDWIKTQPKWTYRKWQMSTFFSNSYGQIKSVFVALVGISIIMMLVFGSVCLGLIDMITNIAPVILAVGAMAVFRTPLHFMTIMIAPMIIGIAVDDIIHYINHFKLAF